MRILIATGGAQHSTLAVLFGSMLAADLAATSTDVKVTFLSVISKKDERIAAEEILTDATALAQRYIPVSETRIRVGYPADAIVDEAEEGEYDLVVVGERQHHSFRTRFLLSATAERVIEHAPCPVIVAKGRIVPVRQILLCEGVRTEDPLVDRAVDQVFSLLSLAQSVAVLHVMSQVSSAPQKSKDALVISTGELIKRKTREGRWLQHDEKSLTEAGIPNPTLKVRHGLVIEEILAEARTGNYDLIIVGAHRGSGWRRILLDDITHQVIVHADRPVLVTR